MTAMASQITSLAVVYSTVYLDADQRKHQSSASLAFMWGIHQDRWIPRTKGQLRGKCFHLMTLSWCDVFVMPKVKLHNQNYCCPVAKMTSQSHCSFLFPRRKPVLPVFSLVTVARFMPKTDIWIIQTWYIAFCSPLTGAEWSDKNSW